MSTIEPALELSPYFSACIALSIRGATAVDLQDHIRDYLIANALLFLGPEDSTSGISPRQRVGKRIQYSVCSQMSYWVEMHRSYQSHCSNIPRRALTAERRLSFFQEKRDLWLGEWAQELDPKSPPTDSKGKLANDFSSHTSRYQSAESVTSGTQKIRDLVHQGMEEGLGVLADTPCSTCVRRRKPYWIYIDDKLGKCLDCVRGVVGEMKLRECSRSRGGICWSNWPPLIKTWLRPTEK